MDSKNKFYRVLKRLVDRARSSNSAGKVAAYHWGLDPDTHPSSVVITYIPKEKREGYEDNPEKSSNI